MVNGESLVPLGLIENNELVPSQFFPLWEKEPPFRSRPTVRDKLLSTRGKTLKSPLDKGRFRGVEQRIKQGRTFLTQNPTDFPPQARRNVKARKCPQNVRVSQSLWIFIFILLSSIFPAFSAPDSTSVPVLRSGAIEVGIGGALISTASLSTSQFNARAARLFAAGKKSLFGLEIESSYAHLRSSNQLDLQGNISWQKPLNNAPVYFLFSAGGGWRQEWLGSFRKSYYPFGFGLGSRVMISNRSAIRIDYQYRQFSHSASGSFSENRIVFSLSLLFRNMKK